MTLEEDANHPTKRVKHNNQDILDTLQEVNYEMRMSFEIVNTLKQRFGLHEPISKQEGIFFFCLPFSLIARK